MKSMKATVFILLALASIFLGGLGTAVMAASAGDRIDLADTNPPASGTGWRYGSNSYTVTGNVIITGNNGGIRSVVLSGGTAAAPLQVTLESVRISGNTAALRLSSGAYVTLTISGSSSLTSSANPGIQTTGATLTIQADTDTASLSVTGGGNAAGIGGASGTTGANGTGNGGHGSAGGNGAAGGTVTILSGSITVNSTNGAGIGGGRGGNGGNGRYGYDGNWDEGNGDSGGQGGSGGIGGAGGSITILGGNVIVRSTNSTAIGGGNGGNGGNGGFGGHPHFIGNSYGNNGSGGRGGNGGSANSLHIVRGTLTVSSTNGRAVGGGNGGTGGTGGNNFAKAAGSAGATGSIGGYGRFTLEPNRIYRWKASTSATEPSGDGSGSGFIHSGSYRFVKVTMLASTVTFKGWDGTVLKTQAVDYGQAAEAPEAPAREYHTFTGWDQDFSIVTGDMTVTAQYAIDTYPVTFVDYDGTVLEEQIIDHGAAAIAPKNPRRAGYAFIGWDKDFSIITGPMTVTAQYEKMYAAAFDGGIAVKIHNDTDETVAGFILAAVYDRQGMLVASAVIEFQTLAGDIANTAFDLDLNDYPPDDYTCSVFFWGEDYTPLTAAIVR